MILGWVCLRIRHTERGWFPANLCFQTHFPFLFLSSQFPLCYFIILSPYPDEFLVHAAPRNQEAFPFVVLGNKSDLQVRRQVSKQKVKQWCAAKNTEIPHFETSAKDAINVENAFHAVVMQALQQESNKPDIMIPSLDLNSQTPANNQQSGGGCC